MTTIQQNSAGNCLPVNPAAEGDGAVATPVLSPVNSTASSANEADTQAVAEAAGTTHSHRGPGGRLAKAPDPRAGDMADLRGPEYGASDHADHDEDDVHYGPFLKLAAAVAGVFAAGFALGFYAYRGLQCGGFL